MRQSHALITGASSGIGEAFARRLAADGASVTLVARRGDRLADLARELEADHGVDSRPVTADLTVREGLDATWRALEGDPPDLVVLNAGFGSTGPFAEQDSALEADMVRLNAVAVVDLAGRVLPDMIARGRGDLIVVSSAAAFQPIPFMATYAATKAFELNFVRALAMELRGTGVRALAVCPGPVHTEFGQAMGADGFGPKVPYSTSDEVVDAALRGLARGRTMVSVGRVASVASLARVVPAAASAAIVGRVHRALRNRPRN